MGLHVTVMAGGAGVRFWPLSRQVRPKQLLPLTGAADGATLLQATVERILPLKPDTLAVVTNARQVDPTCAALAALARPVVVGAAGAAPAGAIRVIGEPRARNTAPAVALAAALLARTDPTGTMIVLPADHHIADPAAFRAVLVRAVAAAADGALVTLGIPPTRPETGYGYIAAEATVGSDETALRVAAFHEKPDRETAQRFLAAGHYLWNSGVFVWRVDAIQDALVRHLPSLGALGRAVVACPAPELATAVAALYERATAISVDYGVMEHHDNVRVVPADVGWSDVGSFAALWELLPKDAAGNAAVGPTTVCDSRGSLAVAAPDGPHVALLGLTDVVVVATGDAVLVCPRERAQDVRDVVAALTARGVTSLL